MTWIKQHTKSGKFIPSLAGCKKKLETKMGDTYSPTPTPPLPSSHNYMAAQKQALSPSENEDTARSG